MPRRVTPPAAEVEAVLRPVGSAARRLARAQRERDDAIRAAAVADPRPTNKQIGDRAGIRESAVRYILQSDP